MLDQPAESPLASGDAKHVQVTRGTRGTSRKGGGSSGAWASARAEARASPLGRSRARSFSPSCGYGALAPILAIWAAVSGVA